MEVRRILGLVWGGRLKVFEPREYQGRQCQIAQLPAESPLPPGLFRINLLPYDGSAVVLEGEVHEKSQESWIYTEGSIQKTSATVSEAISKLFAAPRYRLTDL
jgi:hypothetical protein